MTGTYKGDVKKTIEILQSVLATEIVCVLRYTMHAVAATGFSSEGVKAEFAEHAKEEQEHMMQVAERINQLGGKPNFNPEGLAHAFGLAIWRGRRSGRHDQGKSDRRAHRGRSLPRTDPLFRRRRPGTRVMLEGILRRGRRHANDMHDLLVAHEGRPMLKE